MIVFAHRRKPVDRGGPAAMVVAAGLMAALCAGCGATTTDTAGSSTASTQLTQSSTSASTPTPTALGPDCGIEAANSLAGVFENLPRTKSKAVCPADVDAALAGPEATADLTDVAAAVLGLTDLHIGSEPPGPDGIAYMRVFVGKTKGDSGGPFVEAFLDGLGADARNGTVTLGEEVVQHFVLPDGGDGYAYSRGQNVAVGFMTPLSELHVLDQATVQEPAKDAFFRVISSLNGTPIAADARPELGPGTNPLGRGNYSSPDDPGWVYFTTDSGQHCGISPDGTVAGCDAVTADAPSDTNQTIVDDSGAPARYVQSDTVTFTRDVDVLLGGHRLENGRATCNVGYQGTVTCRIGEHGFTIAGHYGELE